MIRNVDNPEKGVWVALVLNNDAKAKLKESEKS